MQHLQWNITSICLLRWCSNLTERKLPWKCIKGAELYANKAWKIKSCISLHLQEDQQCKSFTTEAVSLNSCDLFLTALVYMQEQQNYFYKTWHIRIEIVLNGCSRSFKDTHREKAPSNKTPALWKSMNMDIWVVGTSNQSLIAGSYTKTKSLKKKNRYWQNCVPRDRSIFRGLFCMGMFVGMLVCQS